MTELVWLKNSDKGVTVREYLTIIEWGWAKYRDLSVASRSIICQSQRLRQITDLRDTDKSRYFATNKLHELFYHLITEFVFLRNVFGKQSNLPFSLKSNCNYEGSVVSFTHEEHIICSQTKLDDSAHEQTIICRHLFAGHVVSSRPMKRK